MAEENRNQQNAEDNKPELNQDNVINHTFTSFVEQEIPQIGKNTEYKKPSKEIFGVKFWLILLCIVFTCSMLSGIYLILNPSSKNFAVYETQKKQDSPIKILKGSSSKEGAAVLQIRGVISETNESSAFSSKQNASTLARRIRDLADKKEIKALLLDINSPGGTVAAVQDIYNALNYFRSKKKPVVALMRDVAASGGFYVAMAADKIVAQPGTMTGSIGVILQTTNAQELLKKIGVDLSAIKSGQNKDIGAIYQSLTPEQKALLQEMIDETYQQFFEAVRKGRPNIDVNTLRIYADGRIFTGARAQTLGLIDGLGGEEKAKEYLSELTGIKDIKIFTPKNRFMEDFLFPFSNLAESSSALKQITQQQTPALAYMLNL